MRLLSRDLLAIYLQDHLAGATFGVELARRAAGQNEGTELGDFLAQLADDIEADRETLVAIMTEFEVGSDRVKIALGWTVEKAGRLKRNGRFVGYSPTSRLLELEGLIAGVNGKLALWQALLDSGRLDRKRLDELIGRAERQIAGLREHHRAAAAEAFSQP